MSDPSFVQLVPRLVNGMCVDVEGGSNWGISGLDVRRFPEDEYAARFVRAKLNAGILEEASQADWDAVHDTDEVTELVGQFRGAFPGMGQPSWQEAQVQRIVQKARVALEADRLEDVESALDELDDNRRKEVLEEQDDMNLGTDDPEEQVGKTTGQRPRKRTAKQAAKRKSRAESED